MAGMARCGVNYWLIDIPIGREVIGYKKTANCLSGGGCDC
jgi:hypothetical protein